MKIHNVTKRSEPLQVPHCTKDTLCPVTFLSPSRHSTCCLWFYTLPGHFQSWAPGSETVVEVCKPNKPPHACTSQLQWKLTLSKVKWSAPMFSNVFYWSLACNVQCLHRLAAPFSYSQCLQLLLPGIYQESTNQMSSTSAIGAIMSHGASQQRIQCSAAPVMASQHGSGSMDGEPRSEKHVEGNLSDGSLLLVVPAGRNGTFGSVSWKALKFETWAVENIMV